MKKGGAKEKIVPSDANCYIEQPISQVKIKQKCVHLQTVLILTQLNSAYHELHLSLNKIFSKLQSKYYASKMVAFLRLTNHKKHIYQAHSMQHLHNCFEIAEGQSYQSENSFKNNYTWLPKLKIKPPNIILQNVQSITTQAFLRLKPILNKLVRILINKTANNISFSIYQLKKYSNQYSTLKILSDKSSKIETIDSQKSKVFKRSAEKPANRKSFSLQKSITNSRHQYFVPIKYQATNKLPTPLSSSNGSIIEQAKKEEGTMSELSKLLQKIPDPLLKERRNLLTSNRQRKILKSSSSKKYNASLLFYGKQQKIKQLQYLQRKYKRLIAQFSWFSQRFLKVIEEQSI